MSCFWKIAHLYSSPKSKSLSSTLFHKNNNSHPWDYRSHLFRKTTEANIDRWRETESDNVQQSANNYEQARLVSQCYTYLLSSHPFSHMSAGLSLLPHPYFSAFMSSLFCPSIPSLQPSALSFWMVLYGSGAGKGWRWVNSLFNGNCVWRSLRGHPIWLRSCEIQWQALYYSAA